jgi:hypothetical protein
MNLFRLRDTDREHRMRVCVLTLRIYCSMLIVIPVQLGLRAAPSQISEIGLQGPKFGPPDIPVFTSSKMECSLAAKKH